MTAVWPALAIAVVGIVAGLIVAIVRGLRIWREFKATGGKLGDRLEEISRAAEEIDTHLSRAADGSERLAGALERLRRSRARLDVQLAAVREARDALERAVPYLGGR